MRPIKHLSLPGYGFAKNLDPERRKMLSEWGEFLAFEAGEINIVEGQHHDSLYLVLEGKLAPSRIINEHSTMPMRAIKRGLVFGEINLFDPSGARATVKALTDGEVWRINREKLFPWLESDHIICREVLMWLCLKFARRARRADDRYADTKAELDNVVGDDAEDDGDNDV